MRLFAGIELDDAARTRCADVQARLKRAAFDARYEAPEKLHITLAFLGNVPEDRRDDVRSVLDEAALQTSRFELTLDRVAAFPNARRPRIVYVGAWTQGTAYSRLAKLVRERYELLGFTFRADSVAHVTVARVKGGSHRPLPVIDVEPVQLTVARIVLFESVQESDTTRYVVRHEAALRVDSVDEAAPGFGQTL